MRRDGPHAARPRGGKCDGGEDKRRRFRTGGSKVSSTGVEGLGRVQSRLFGGLQSSLLGASQLLLVLLSGGVGLGLVFGVEACLRGLEGGLGLVERGLGGLDVLVGLRLRIRYTLCRFIYLALRRAPLRGLGGLGYLSARPVHW